MGWLRGIESDDEDELESCGGGSIMKGKKREEIIRINREVDVEEDEDDGRRKER